MEQQYLTPERKAYYLRDFNENVLTEAHEFWKLGSASTALLTALNAKPTIQTLYSRYYPESSKRSFDKDSYLTLAYAKELELPLFRDVLPALLQAYKSQDYVGLYYYHQPPKDNANYRDGESNFKMGCITDPDYFRINHVCIYFDHWQDDQHASFWSDLKERLLALS